MLIERWNLLCLMVELMANTMVLILRRYLTLTMQDTYFFETILFNKVYVFLKEKLPVNKLYYLVKFISLEITIV